MWRIQYGGKNGALGRVETRRVRQHPALVFLNEIQKTMSTKPTTELEVDEPAQKRAQAEQFSYEVQAPGMVEVANESHDTPADHQYVVTLDDVSGDVMACTCPHHVHRHAFYKHMVATQNAAADDHLDAFLLDEEDTDDDGPRVIGPHIGFDKYRNADHRYWRCEE
ncbi:SWIM zinc finger family protein [Haladaptatus halobius]|uniref:SWIM zinc finger family protein n=1 Tax=Haladaptatus halobius TaxID=2884875 RepID=UPI001D09DC5F|nr:SWIM zinc finger family protein [Haladaptatus halobius]